MTSGLRSGPMPAEWFTVGGAPLEAMAAYAEGMCPVHRTPLASGHVRTGGKGGLPLRWIAGGWCDDCRAWWHRPYQDGMTNGLAATYDAC